MSVDDVGLILGVSAERVEPLRDSSSSSNPQLWESSGQESAQSTLSYAENPDRLHLGKVPNLAVKSEQPEHRIMCLLKSQGQSNREIALAMNYSDAHVSQILRQPWARTRIVQLINERKKDPIMEVLRGSALDSVYTLIDQRDSPVAKPSERISACNSLLDRFLGKPTQTVVSTNTNISVDGSIAELDAQLATLRADEQALVNALKANSKN